MFESRKTLPHEFTIYKAKGPSALYVIELDGDDLAFGSSSFSAVEGLDVAHKYIKKVARERGLKGAGVTEVFGRNRQFIITPRFALKPFKGE